MGGPIDAQYNAAVETVKQQLINAGIKIVIVDSLAPNDALINRILQGMAFDIWSFAIKKKYLKNSQLFQNTLNTKYFILNGIFQDQSAFWVM